MEMPTQTKSPVPAQTKPSMVMPSKSNIVMPNQLQEAAQTMASLTKLLLEISNVLIALRREFRGEGIYQDDKGSNHWVQISKPIFVRTDFETGEPIKKKVKMPWSEEGKEEEIYVPNDEAIDEILSMLKFSGINQITPIGFITEDNYLDDLREFECKLAAVLALKQKEWGMDKELLPMLQFKIKTIVQDVRSMCVKGVTLKALQTTVQRVEQLIEGQKQVKKEKVSPYS